MPAGCQLINLGVLQCHCQAKAILILCYRLAAIDLTAANLTTLQ